MHRWSSNPEPIRAECFTAMPPAFRRPRVTPWSIANIGGKALDCFLEGPSFDRTQALFVTDIPNGRVFRIDATGAWSLVVEYDGWPNGLKFDAKGTAYVADHKLGILVVDVTRGTVTPLLPGFRSEGFKGVNDLFFDDHGDLWFTDQGQSGWQDPTGRLFRYGADGRLSCVAQGIPSPNGVCMNADQTAVYLAVTRANAVWRLPLMDDGTVSKVGTWLQLSGGVGPDGLALDVDGGLAVAHPGTTVWRYNRYGVATHFVDVDHDPYFTNIAFGGGADAQVLHITDSFRGEIWKATLPAQGAPMYSHRETGATDRS